MKRATITYNDERVLRAIAAMGRELGFYGGASGRGR